MPRFCRWGMGGLLGIEEVVWVGVGGVGRGELNWGVAWRVFLCSRFIIFVVSANQNSLTLNVNTIRFLFPSYELILA